MKTGLHWPQQKPTNRKLFPLGGLAHLRPRRNSMTTSPQIIQGGMGAAVSNWQLANSVSRLGQLGVVSGTALAVVLSRRLQLGDPGGHMRRALSQFPVPAVAKRVLQDHYVPGGKGGEIRYRSLPMPTLQPARLLEELTVAANFVEVFLAKHGHGGVVGLNLMEKLQFPTLPSLYGAMLAGVDYVLMGAGIPRSIPGVLDRFAEGEPAELKIDVLDAAPGEETLSRFDPRAFCGGVAAKLMRPRFLGIVASAALALTLTRKSNGRIDGFVIEGDTAGGHNAPPRGPMQLSDEGEPVYGERDLPDLEKIRELGLPFWLAGSYGLPGKLAEALATGAAGIQVGTAFALCEESGMAPELKAQILALSRDGKARVFTDPVASPTGFPFKVVQAEGTLSEVETYEARQRICNMGYLRRAYRRPDGSLGYRCPAEPVADYVRKGGAEAETTGRKCVCNGLLAAIGLAHVDDGSLDEPALLTAGREVANVAQFLKPGFETYTAADVVQRLLGTES
jgi:NAD(P)H-dependent flavin oxidoreductase YrpB (nitropropane dioxygenase family)